MCIPMLMSSITAVRWKPPRCRLTDKWINKWSTPTMKYHSALKRHEILIHATSWMNLKDTVLSEMSQTQQGAYCIIPLTWRTQGQKVERELPRAEGKRKEQFVFNGQSFSVGQWKVLEMSSADGCTTTWAFLMPLDCMRWNGKFHVTYVLPPNPHRTA